MKRESSRDRLTVGKRNRVAKERQTSCFTLEINQRPVLVLAAPSLSSAVRRISEDWFVEELGRMRSVGCSILRPRDRRQIRPANPEEVARLKLERSLDQVRGEDTKYAFAFLIPVDKDPN